AHAARERGLEVEGGAVADLGRGPRGGERQRERAMWYPHERAQRELSALARPPERRVGARLLQGLDAGDTALQRFVLRPQGCRVAIGLGRRRDGAVRELVGPLLQNAGGRSASVSEDRRAFGGHRRLSDLRGPTPPR